MARHSFFYPLSSEPEYTLQWPLRPSKKSPWPPQPEPCPSLVTAYHPKSTLASEGPRACEPATGAAGALPGDCRLLQVCPVW